MRLTLIEPDSSVLTLHRGLASSLDCHSLSQPGRWATLAACTPFQRLGVPTGRRVAGGGGGGWWGRGGGGAGRWGGGSGLRENAWRRQGVGGGGRGKEGSLLKD